MTTIPEKSLSPEEGCNPADKAISSIFIQGQEDYLGIFTNTDLVNRVVAKRDCPKMTTALSVATFPVLAIDLCLTLEESKEKMLHHKVKWMAVTMGRKDRRNYFNERHRPVAENFAPSSARSVCRGNST